MRIHAIAAIDFARGLGTGKDLLYHSPLDMQFFKQQTRGHIVISGRKNYETIPERFRPLPGRENIILSRQSPSHTPTLHEHWCASVKQALQTAKTLSAGEKDVYIIGGSEIYSAFSHYIESWYLTRFFENTPATIQLDTSPLNEYSVVSIRYAHDASNSLKMAFYHLLRDENCVICQHS